MHVRTPPRERNGPECLTLRILLSRCEGHFAGRILGSWLRESPSTRISGLFNDGMSLYVGVTERFDEYVNDENEQISPVANTFWVILGQCVRELQMRD